MSRRTQFGPCGHAKALTGPDGCRACLAGHVVDELTENPLTPERLQRLVNLCEFDVLVANATPGLEMPDLTHEEVSILNRRLAPRHLALRQVGGRWLVSPQLAVVA